MERTAFAMGTLLRVEVAAADRACGLAATEAVLAEVARLELVLSSWAADSEVGRLNTAPAGEWRKLSPELWGLLAEARELSRQTAGAFDPGIGALVAAWDLRGAGRVPSPGALTAALAASGVGRLAFDAADSLAARPRGEWWLDTGAFGKGAALRAAAAVLRSLGVADAVLDFGGQLLVLGDARPVAVSHAAERQRPVAWLQAGGGASISTTSSSERFVTVAGARLGHVLDPRRGRPVPAWGSVTVVAADALAADAVSTALFVLGPDAALEWAAAHPEYGVLVQEPAGDDVAFRYSASLEPLLLSNDNQGSN